VLDGWWEEPTTAVQLGHRVAGRRAVAAGHRDATAAFNLIENEVIPLFYERGADGIPRRWLARVKASLARLAPRFSAERMLREYAERLWA
jgi:starch phosphorylase